MGEPQSAGNTARSTIAAPCRSLIANTAPVAYGALGTPIQGVPACLVGVL